MRRYLARVDAVLIQAVIAGALSFAHLHGLAEAAGQEGWKAWAWFVIALCASLGANIATAGLLDLNDVPDWLRILVAGWPAIAFLGGTLLAHSPRAGDEEAGAVESSAERHEDVQAVPLAEPAVEPAPAPEPAPTALPTALVEHARKVADAHQERTGAPSTPTPCALDSAYRRTSLDRSSPNLPEKKRSFARDRQSTLPPRRSHRPRSGRYRLRPPRSREAHRSLHGSPMRLLR